MISFASDNTFQDIYNMWKICFQDSDEFMKLYFNEKYQPENTLVYIDNNKVVASLQMLPYRFTFCETEIPVSYISGACTLPEYQNKGYMRQLLRASLQIMREREIPLSLLIPAEDWLYNYYGKFGYKKVFESDNTIIPLKEIFTQSGCNLNKAYKTFDNIFGRRDFCIQKTEKDFATIIKDAEMSDFPEKYNLSGMARIINAETLLTLFAAQNEEQSFRIRVNDSIIEENNHIYNIENGKCRIITDKTDSSTYTVEIEILCQLLFGFELNSLSDSFSKRFPVHHPILNLMLE